jgi:hypothetical protein
MYPHRLSWGPAYHFPFSLVIALLTLVGLIFTKEHRQPKGGAAAAVLCVFLAWSAFVTLFAFNPEPAMEYLDRVAKVFLMTLVLLLLMHTREQVEALLWCLVIALGFYGTKGGLFTLITGGNFMVMGPPDSPMEGNNSLGVGTVIIIPLMYYLWQVSEHRIVRFGLLVAMPLCAVSVLGSYSRGAFLAILAIGRSAVASGASQTDGRDRGCCVRFGGHPVHARQVDGPNEYDPGIRGRSIGDAAALGMGDCVQHRQGPLPHGRRIRVQFPGDLGQVLPESRVLSRRTQHLLPGAWQPGLRGSGDLCSVLLVGLATGCVAAQSTPRAVSMFSGSFNFARLSKCHW